MAENQATLWLKIKSSGEEAFASIKEKLESLGGATGLVTAGFAALSALVVKSIAEFKEKEDAVKQLTTAMINNGIYTGELAHKYSEQSEALAKLSLFGDSQIVQAQAIIQAQIGQREVTEKLTKATLDFAQANAMDLASAAAIVGKTIGGTTNALSRYGIEVADGITKTERMDQAIEGLNRKFGGQAESATSGLGAMTMLHKAMNDIFETIGSRLAPILVPFIKKWTEFISTSTEIKQGIEIIDFGFRALVNTVNIVTNVISMAWQLMMNHIGTAAAIVAEVVAGNFKNAGNMAVDYFKNQGNIIKDAAVKTYDEITKNDQAYTQAKADELKKREANEAASLARQKEAAAIKAAEEDVTMLEHLIKDEQNSQGLIVNADKLAMAKLQVRQKELDDDLKLTTDARKKAALLGEKFDNEMLITEQKNAELQKANKKDTLGTIAGMQNSSNKTLATIGKAAALTQIAIDTPLAISKALAAFPPPFNYVAAGAVGVAMAAQAAQVAGIQLADGGIVRARPGGIQATIGEGGQDEAVIPLDRMGDMGMGGGTYVINVYGGMLGDQSSAREFAVAVDKELFKLRKNNESVSFDGIVI